MFSIRTLSGIVLYLNLHNTKLLYYQQKCIKYLKANTDCYISYVDCIRQCCCFIKLLPHLRGFHIFVQGYYSKLCYTIVF